MRTYHKYTYDELPAKLKRKALGPVKKRHREVFADDSQLVDPLR